MSIVGMFWLALKRYGLDVSGAEAFYTFLYLTRDTFSPWENLALLLDNYDKIEFQGLAPIIRDFYVFIPSWVWPERPDVVLNYKSAILQAFCFGAIFNMIVLAREGVDSFVSRVVFFCLIFGLCLVVAKLLYWLFESAGLVRNYVTRQLQSEPRLEKKEK